jgi:hypothetical protein
MTYELFYDVTVENESGEFGLFMIESISINKSIDNLADTAKISLPAYVFNKRIKRNMELLQRGNKIKIELGYKGVSEHTEFQGFIKEVHHGEEIIIECEDDLFMFRKRIPNKQFKPANVKQIADYICSQLGPEITIICDFDLPYEKFTIYEQTGLDVLLKIQESTGSNVFFKSKEKELHIRAKYTVMPSTKEVCFSPQRNVEGMKLEYVDTLDKKVQITIKGKGLDGKHREIQYGNISGDKFEFTMNNMPIESMKARAKMEFERSIKPGYSGSIDTWLIPYVEPGQTIWYEDEDFPEQAGEYLANSVETTFGRDGGKRTIQFGIRLS